MFATFNPLDHPVVFATPRWVTPGSPWLEHVPCAMLLVDLVRPATVVSLGGEPGVPYLALCQAVDELSLESRCYAVDAGPGGGGEQSDGVASDDVRRHHDPLYGRFSRLLRSSVDGARSRFDDGSIDLLQVVHTASLGGGDLKRWLPKIRPGGVILLHGVDAASGDGFVPRLWAEVHEEYPSFSLVHGGGLGLFVIGQPGDGVDSLVKAEGEELESMRRFLFGAGRGVAALARSQVSAGLERDRATNAALLAKALDLIERVDAERQQHRERADHLDAELARLGSAPTFDDILLGGELAKSRAAHAALVAQVDAILRSKSWRMSRPFRVIWSVLRGQGPRTW